MAQLTGYIARRRPQQIKEGIGLPGRKIENIIPAGDEQTVIPLLPEQLPKTIGQKVVDPLCSNSNSFLIPLVQFSL
jgi:hypothetical protein